MSHETDDLKRRFDRLVENLGETYGLTYSDILALSSEQASEQASEHGTKRQRFVPLDVLRSRQLGILEALTVHLHDTQGMRFCDIARALQRDSRTIWATYDKAKKKLKSKRR